MTGLQVGIMAKMLNNAFDQILNQATLALGLTSSQSMVLGYLCDVRDNVVMQKDIEAHFNFKHPTVTGILKRLEIKDFVKCYTDDNDHRCKRVEATQKSLEMHRQMQKLTDDTANALLSVLSEEEQKDFLRLFERITKNLQE